MSCYDILTPPSETVTIAGRSVVIRPATMSQLGEFLAEFAPVAQLLSSGLSAEILSPETITAMRALVAYVCGITMDDIDPAPLMQVIRIAGSIATLNRELCEEVFSNTSSEITSAIGRPNDTNSFADGMQALISHGHMLDAIRGYTYAQFRAFIAAVERSQQAEFRKLAIAARMAQYDKNGWRKAMKGLSDGK